MTGNRAHNWFRRHAAWLAAPAVLAASVSCGRAASGDAAETAGSAQAAPWKADRRLRAETVEALLWAELDQCFPQRLRPGGGYRAVVEPRPEDPVFGVQQARLTWLAAEVARRRPDAAERYRGYADHGIEMLAGPMWDETYGGWFWQLPADASTPADGADAEKHLYGQVFGIYAASNAYRATGNPDALRLAQEGFAWLETHARDTDHGGYFEVFARDGRPLMAADESQRNKKRDHIGTPFGHKSMNAHIHALEAITALYAAWPDAAVRERLEELLTIVRDRITQPGSGLTQVLTLDWRPTPGHRSFGHEVETAYLMIEAAEALGFGEDAQTRSAARQLVDDALAQATEADTGALLEDPGAETLQRPWWAQVEMLNALMLMDETYGGETPAYREAAARLWAYIVDEQVDENGRWLTAAQPGGGWGGRRWYAAYHTGRSLLEVADRLAKPVPLPASTHPPAPDRNDAP